MNVFIQNLQEIGTSTLSKMLKTLNTHNFLNSYRKILISKIRFQKDCFDSKKFNQRRIFAVPLNQFVFDSDSLHNLPK